MHARTHALKQTHARTHASRHTHSTRTRYSRRAHAQKRLLFTHKTSAFAPTKIERNFCSSATGYFPTAAQVKICLVAFALGFSHEWRRSKSCFTHAKKEPGNSERKWIFSSVCACVELKMLLLTPIKVESPFMTWAIYEPAENRRNYCLLRPGLMKHCRNKRRKVIVLSFCQQRKAGIEKKKQGGSLQRTPLSWKRNQACQVRGGSSARQREISAIATGVCIDRGKKILLAKRS